MAGPGQPTCLSGSKTAAISSRTSATSDPSAAFTVLCLAKACWTQSVKMARGWVFVSQLSLNNIGDLFCFHLGRVRKHRNKNWKHWSRNSVRKKKKKKKRVSCGHLGEHTSFWGADKTSSKTWAEAQEGGPGAVFRTPETVMVRPTAALKPSSCSRGGCATARGLHFAGNELQLSTLTPA